VTTTVRDGDKVVLTCRGAAETEALEALDTALSALHDDAVRTPTRTVFADVRDLEFASSSCLKSFVSWLQRVQELDDEHRYKVVFRSNPEHSWQRRSLGALAAFAAGVVQIEEESR
jgi:hypothetical protein